MHDYFGEFLLNTSINPVVARQLGNSSDSNSTIPLKIHLVWALVASGGILLSWKASGMYAQYRLMSEKPKKPKKRAKAKAKAKAKKAKKDKKLNKLNMAKKQT